MSSPFFNSIYSTENIGSQEMTALEKIFKIGLFFLYIHVYNTLGSLWTNNRRPYL